MYESVTNARSVCGWIRLNAAMLIPLVLLSIASTGWAVIALTRNAHPVQLPLPARHPILAEHMQTPEVNDALPVAPAPRARRPVLVLPAGMEAVSLAINFPGCGGVVVPGSRVDVLATGRYEGKLRAFPMLLDHQILAVDNWASQVGTFFGTDTVLLAVTNEEARLVRLAKARGCHLEILLRHPHACVECGVDPPMIERVLNLLSPVELRQEALPTAPAPRVKGLQ